jgi:hypothetical protein
VATAAALSCALAGCGISHPAVGTTAAAPEAVSAAHDSPKVMFKEMTHALRKVRSVSIDFEVKPNHGPSTRILTELELPGRVEATVIHGGAVVNERWIGDDIYFRYNAYALLKLTGNALYADALHDRWIQLPAAALPLAQSMRHMATAKMLQECDVLGPTGKLTIGGTSTLNGLPAVTLHDHGGKPGTARRTITLSANPPFLPLQIVQTHEGRPGGPAFDACFSNRGTRTLMRRAEQVSSHFNKAHHVKLHRAVESITRYDQPLHLTKPPHPIGPKGSVESTSNRLSL